MNQEFPTVKQLYHGSMLRSIAHAVSTAFYPDLSYEIFWDEQHYHCNDSEGTQGAITFAKEGVIGALNDFDSNRNPFLERNNHKTYDITPYFEGIPTALREIAERETLQYLIEDYRNQHIPVVTTAFWSSGEYLTAAESWKSVYKHGAHLLRIELMPFETAISALEEDYEFPIHHLELVQTILNKKMALQHEKMTLTDNEYDLLICEGDEGISESEELFNAMQIYFPMQK